MSETATIDLASIHPPATTPTLRVLVVDGNERTRDVRTAQLNAAGFRVSLARTGFEAIVKACCQIPDLIVMDDSLAELDSAETGRLITTCPTTAHIPIVRLLPGRRVPQRALRRLRRVAV